MRTLIWKEWREQRLSFLLYLATILLAAMIFGFAGRMFVCFTIAAFLGTSVFIHENTRKTQEFLLSNPVSTTKIYWAKFLSGLSLALIFFLLTLLLYNVLLLFPYFIRKALSDDLTLLKQPHFCCFIIILIYSATLLTSLLTKNTMVTLLCSWFVAFATALLLLPLLIHLFSMVSIEQIFSPTAFPLSIGNSPTSIGIKLYYLFVLFTLIAIFAVYGLIIWQKAISKEANPTRVILKLISVLIVISFIAQLVFHITASISLKKEIKRLKTAGIPLTMEEVIPPPISDEENAAVIYQQAFNLLEILDKKYPEEFKLLSHVYYVHNNLDNLTSEQKQRFSRLALNDTDFINLFQLLEKAASLPACRFDIQYEEGSEAELPHLSKMRKLAQLLGARTYFLTKTKRYKEAMKSAETGFRMADMFIDEPLSISQFVRFAIDTITIDSLQTILNSPQSITPDNYEKLLSEIENKNPSLQLAGDIAICGGSHSLFQKILDGDIEPLKIWWIIQPQKVLKTTGGQFYGFLHTDRMNFFESLVVKVYLGYLNKPAIQEDYRFYLYWNRRNFALSKMPYYQLRNEAALLDRDLSNNQKPCYTLSTKFLLPSTYMYSRKAQYIATLDTFKLGLALRIYQQKNGTYPDSLTFLAPEIIPEIPLDPFTGKNYIYLREGKGLIVYSIGPNGKDDNGIYDSKKRQDDISFKVTN